VSRLGSRAQSEQPRNSADHVRCWGNAGARLNAMLVEILFSKYPLEKQYNLTEVLEWDESACAHVPLYLFV
jgi:hypothetical protein